MRTTAPVSVSAPMGVSIPTVPIDEHRLDADATCPDDVGLGVVPDVDRGVGRDLEQVERVLEDGGVWLLVADSGADAHDLEVSRQLQRLQQLWRIPAPVADHAQAQAGRLHGVEGREDVGKDEEGRALPERTIDVAEERFGQVRVAETIEDELVQLGQAPERGLLGGLEGALVGPLDPRGAERRLEVLHGCIDTVALEDGGVDVTP